MHTFAATLVSRLTALLVTLAASVAWAGPVEDLFARSARVSTAPVDHSAWDKLLKTYVIPGADGLNRVDYARFKKEGQAALKSYLTALQSVDPGQLDRSDQFAFLANLYNAKTIALVLERYPVASIKDISLGGGVVAAITGGPWKAKVLRLKGVELSLDDIEHTILRPTFKDPRVHYAVNCASIGCPNLSTEAFVGATLEAQLERAARAFINSPRAFRFDGDSLISSSIYSWFKTDFGGTDAGVLKHARRFAAPPLAAKLAKTESISTHDYDWRLNDIVR
jgi:Protein of unknown function, DUF547